MANEEIEEIDTPRVPAVFQRNTGRSIKDPVHDYSTSFTVSTEIWILPTDPLFVSVTIDELVSSFVDTYVPSDLIDSS